MKVAEIWGVPFLAPIEYNVVHLSLQKFIQATTDSETASPPILYFFVSFRAYEEPSCSESEFFGIVER